MKEPGLTLKQPLSRICSLSVRDVLDPAVHCHLQIS